jgi:hypothetical protein
MENSNLATSVKHVLSSLEDSIRQLSEEQYIEKISTLSGSTIGQHVRHVLEMFICLQEGLSSGIVNYENRKRDFEIETKRELAIFLMETIKDSLAQENLDLILHAGFDESSEQLNKLPTNYFREVVYNLEHAIHHMALIKIGILEVSDIIVPQGYGVASSTLKYKKTLLPKK